MFKFLLIPVATLLLAPPAVSQEIDSDEDAAAATPRKIGYHTSDLGFSGPASVPSQLDEDDILKDPVYRYPKIDAAFASWQATKKRYNDEKDIQFGFDYNTLSQGLSDSIASEAGYIGVTGTLFSDTDGLTLVDFNYQQSFNDGNTGLIVGRFDPNDYMDVLGHSNPWTTFSNVASLLNPSIALPDAMLGIGAGHRFMKQWYVKGSINDANGLVSETKVFQGGAEFFKWAELGWTPSPDQHYFNNIHVVAWHVDEREDAGLPSAHGIAIGANKTSDDQRWMGFVRAGWSDGIAPIYNETYTVGVLRRLRRNADVLGLAINWGDPPDSSLSSQTTGELFYRVQFAQNLAITPSIQMLKDPTLNPTEDIVWVWSLRFRLTM